MWSRPQLGKGDSRAIEASGRGTLLFDGVPTFIAMFDE
jgi:hypothetical protein